MIACSILTLLASLLGRGLAPSDTDDKAQPITMRYTVNMIEHGQWLVPEDHRGKLATKPLLYNWLAVPAVWIAGVDSEFAHKLPSVLSLVGCFVLLVLLGMRIGGENGALGWLTAMIFLANYTIFQLGYLARTDMLLTFWLLLGWVAGTQLLLRSAQPMPVSGLSRNALRVGFWACVGFAALTKGPPALVLLVFALVAPRLLCGRWSGTAHFGWWWGLPLSMLPLAAWIYGVWVVAPDHLVEQLWGQEFFGRVTGLGDEGNSRGPVDFIYKLFHMPLYYTSRFLPWSILSFLAIYTLYKQFQKAEPDQAAPFMNDTMRSWLHSAAVLLAVVITLFSLSTGKRAAYIASAYGPGALLAGWFVLHLTHERRTTLAVGLTMAATVVIMAAMITYRWNQFA